MNQESRQESPPPPAQVSEEGDPTPTALPSSTPTSATTPTPTDSPKPTPTPTSDPTTTASTPPPAPAPEPKLPPPTPVLAAPVVENRAAVITGVNIGGFQTLFPILSGTAEPGDTVTVVLSGSSSESIRITADARGTWSSGPFTNLAPGSYTATATATRNTTASAVNLQVAPPPMLTANSDTPTVTIRGVGHATVQILINGTRSQVVSLAANGIYQGTLDLGPGVHTLIPRYCGVGHFGVAGTPILVTAS